LKGEKVKAHDLKLGSSSRSSMRVFPRFRVNGDG
jgi:hypothetical protein